MNKLWKYIFRAGVTATLLIALVGALVICFPKQRVPSAGNPPTAVIVLGAAPNSPAIRYRVLRGHELAESLPAGQLVLSGGRTSPQDESEAQNMARFVSQFGGTVPVVLEEKSTNTWENLSNTKKFLPEDASVVLVSDEYHLARAVLFAYSLGYSKVFWASPDSSYYRPGELAWYYCREVAAILRYFPRAAWVFVDRN
jgi:uncharacterized SAM-binding protein YcdF (DUF218 family)